MSALDLKNQAFFLKIIKQLSDEGKTVLFSTHNPNHALLLKCDVVMMKDGSITCHDKAVHCLTQINISNVFGDEVHLIENEFGSSAVLKL